MTSFSLGGPGALDRLLALGLFVGGLVYLVLVVFDAIDRPWARRPER